jgi:hypothetical protein
MLGRSKDQTEPMVMLVAGNNHRCPVCSQEFPNALGTRLSHSIAMNANRASMPFVIEFADLPRTTVQCKPQNLSPKKSIEWLAIHFLLAWHGE